MSKRLVLGTVQLGMAYGIANRDGQVAVAEAAAILDCAQQAGVDTLDTAVAYRESESRLGELGVQRWNVITKLPPLPASCGDAGAWVRDTVAASLARLKIDKLHGLLLHRSQDLAGAHGQAIYAAMAELKAVGQVARIGVSIYRPAELESLSPHVIDLVQAPCNVFDRRIVNSGWLARLGAAGIEVHLRSAFLQGLLLMPSGERPARFARWQRLWDAWEEWLRAHALTPLQACLGFAFAQPAAGVVVGVDSRRQLAEILKVAGSAMHLAPPDDLCSDDPDLVDPSRWSGH